MDIIDYFATNLKKISSRFYVIKKEEEKTEEELLKEESLYLPSDMYENFNIFNNVQFIKPNMDDINYHEIITMGFISFSSIIFLKNINTIFNILYGIQILCTGFGLSFAVYSYCDCMFDYLNDTQKKNKLANEEMEKYLDSFEYKYDMFLIKDLETMRNIYQDDLLVDYSNNDKNFLKSLKEEKNHFEIDLPFEKNNKLIMFYDYETEQFVYYTQNSDVLYKVLNSCCRQYVLKYNCVQLYKDEIDIEYFKDIVVDEKEQDKTNKKQKRTNSDQEIIDNYEIVENEDTKEKTEKPKSIFYNKREKFNKDKEEVITKNEKIINKYIHKGNLTEYENTQKKTEKTAKNVDYNLFKAMFSGGNKVNNNKTEN